MLQRRTERGAEGDRGARCGSRAECCSRGEASLVVAASSAIGGIQDRRTETCSVMDGCSIVCCFAAMT